MRWLNFALDHCKVDAANSPAEFSAQEREKFEESVDLIRQFGKVDALVEEVGKLRKEFKVLYTEIARESATSSVIGHNEVPDLVTKDLIQ